MAKRTFTRRFRQQFLEAWFRSEGCTFIDHCQRFGVSRANGYEWRRRYDPSDPTALDARSSAPGECPHATDGEIVELLLEARREHPTWGPRKLRAWLIDSMPFELELPAPSTIGDILKRGGLVSSKKRRRRPSHYPTRSLEVKAPNDVWSVDFKGHFRLRSKRYCYPLTMLDSYSRYLLVCDGYYTADGRCRRSFERAFIEFGMPRAIRSDNGPPFAASQSLAGLCDLNVWWVRLGIIPQRITPGSPWENGRHERMHRTLKAEATDPPQMYLAQQQRTFDSFRAEYNQVRPHEALGLQTPAKNYTASKRSYPRKLRELEYPAGYQLRRVSDAGLISWNGYRLFLSSVLRGQIVGLQPLADATAKLTFGALALGIVDCTGSKPRVLQASDD